MWLTNDPWGRRTLVAAAITVGIIAACSKKEPIVEPPPVQPGIPHIQGNFVVWDTDRPARGAVRYAFTRSGYDHMSYPNAAGRVDRAYTVSHSVPLLDLTPGRTVYYQTVSEPSDTSPTYSALDSFVATTGPTSELLVSTMIHIGFGDSHLLTMPRSGKRFLIDSGLAGAGPAVMQYL